MKKAAGYGPDEKIARAAMKEGEKLFREKKYNAAAEKFATAAARWPDSPLEEDALFLKGECEFFSDQYPKADDTYGGLLKKYANTRHLDTVMAREFALGRYWEQLNDKKPLWPIAPNVTDGSRPRFDTLGYAIKAYERVRQNDPTGPRADDSLMALGNVYFRSGRFEDAAYQYDLLRKEYPNSEFQMQAHLLGLQAKMRVYQGTSYDGAPLKEGEKIADQTLSQFGNKLGDGTQAGRVGPRPDHGGRGQPRLRRGPVLRATRELRRRPLVLSKRGQGLSAHRKGQAGPSPARCAPRQAGRAARPLRLVHGFVGFQTEIGIAMSDKRYYAAPLAMLLLLSGCAGYQIGNQTLYPADIRTVYVPMFDSNSFRRGLGERLTEAVVKEIEAQTDYKVVNDPNTADSVLSGAIVSERKSVLVPDLSGSAREVQVGMTVEVSWVDRKGRLLRENAQVPLPSEIVNISGTGDLVPEVGQSVATAQQKAICRMAEQIVGLMEKPW